MIPGAIVLRVFSGVHLGACLSLQPGEWEIGADDACDLILQGLAPHHAKLTVGEGESPSVSVLPLDGAVLVAGSVVSEETSVPVGEAWYLGDTCLAWNLPGVEQEPIVPKAFYAEQKDKDEDVPASEPTPEEPESAEQSQETEEAGEAGGADASKPVQEEELPEQEPLRMEEESKEKAPESVLKKYRRPLLLLVLALLLGGLSVFVTTGPSFDEYPALVQDVLAKEGFTGFAIQSKWPGVVVSGSLEDPQDLERVQTLVQELSFPVFLDVSVEDDAVRAVRNALEVRGFYPIVRMTRPQSLPVLTVTCFMRDRLVEADAFAGLAKEVPLPVEIVRRIISQDDVASEVLRVLQEEGLSDDVSPVYLPNRIVLTGNVAQDQNARLLRVSTSLSQRFGVPLFGEGNFLRHGTKAPKSASASRTVAKISSILRTAKIGSSQGTSRVSGLVSYTKNLKQGDLFRWSRRDQNADQDVLQRALDGKNVAVPNRGKALSLPMKDEKLAVSEKGGGKALVEQPLEGMTVTGVFRAPLNFVTTQDGRRFFLGSTLPSGYILEGISTDALLLRKGNTVLTYRLRGSHE
ncbi:MAG: type III secretion system inner membrane ring subunit SctD [Desulfovibrio sp.]|nr:type III secretion system inner membrane ring subunit SctD [Desulfovibrio sp.]